jgi:hypothetical protein
MIKPNLQQANQESASEQQLKPLKPAFDAAGLGAPAPTAPAPDAPASDASTPAPADKVKAPFVSTPAPDPYDLDRLSLPTAYAEVIGVQKLLTHVPIEKPHKQDWFRVHPDPSFSRNLGVNHFEEDGQVYFVRPDLMPHLASFAVPVTLYTTITAPPASVLRLWAIRLPGMDGKDNAYWSTARDAAQRATKVWMQIHANQKAKFYDVYNSILTVTPAFPSDVTFQEIFTIAAKGRIIESLDNPIVLKLQRGF